MDNISKDIKTIILNYNNWDIENLLSKMKTFDLKHKEMLVWNNINIENLIIKCIRYGYI